MDNYQDDLREKIEEAKKKKKRVWNMFCRHSCDYESLLHLNQDDLGVLLTLIQEPISPKDDLREIGRKGFLKVRVKDKAFKLVVRRVGSDCDENLRNFIMAVCMSDQLIDQSLNEHLGRSGDLISTIPEDYHQAIIDELREPLDLS